MREVVWMWNRMRGDWSNMRRVLWNKFPRNEMEPGSHIYTWRWSEEAHHGIYFDDGNVFHFTQGGLSSNRRACQNCGNQPRSHGVVSSCLDCFLSGGDHDLYLFEYCVSPVLFLLKPGWNTCTITRADPNYENVIHRAFFLLRNRFVNYHLCIKNSYDFAIYCKTGPILFTSMDVSRNESAASFCIVVFVFFSVLENVPPSFTDLTAAGLGISSACRLALDVGAHPNFIQAEVDRFAKVDTLASHYLDFPRVIRFFLKVVLIALTCAYICLDLRMWWSNSRPLVWALAGFRFSYWAVYNRVTFSVPGLHNTYD